jgi:adhesin transport system outer membrane protein
VNEGGMARMERFEYVMSARVNAGINDRANLQLVQQKLAKMRSDVLEDREAASTAQAELDAMSATSLDGVSGIETIADPVSTAQPLDVMKVEAQGTRGMAEARALQAGYSPNPTSRHRAQSGRAARRGSMLVFPTGLVLCAAPIWPRLTPWPRS